MKKGCYLTCDSNIILESNNTFSQLLIVFLLIRTVHLFPIKFLLEIKHYLITSMRVELRIKLFQLILLKSLSLFLLELYTAVK